MGEGVIVAEGMIWARFRVPQWQWVRVSWWCWVRIWFVRVRFL